LRGRVLFVFYFCAWEINQCPSPYVSNHTIRNDLNIKYVRDEAKTFQKYNSKIVKISMRASFSGWAAALLKTVKLFLFYFLLVSYTIYIFFSFFFLSSHLLFVPAGTGCIFLTNNNNEKKKHLNNRLRQSTCSELKERIRIQQLVNLYKIILLSVIVGSTKKKKTK